MGRAPMTMATRGGGFHKPDPLPYPGYKNTRRHHVEDINTSFYSDIAPEFHLHLHSIQIKTGKQGWMLIGTLFLGIICPCWAVAYISHKKGGSNLFPAVRPGPHGTQNHLTPQVKRFRKETR